MSNVRGNQPQGDCHEQGHLERRHAHRVRPGGARSGGSSGAGGVGGSHQPHLVWHDRATGTAGPQFTVITYDRRGLGTSGDTPPYAVEREVEDIEALIDAAGGTASLYGLSSG